MAQWGVNWRASSLPEVVTQRRKVPVPERQAGGRAGRGPHGGLTRVGAQVHGELAGVAAGVGAELALVGPLVRVDAQVLLEAAAVHGRVVAEVALVRLHAGVAAHMHGQVVLPAEALVTELALVRLVPCKHTSKSHGFRGSVHQDAGREIQPRRWAESRALPFPSDQTPGDRKTRRSRQAPWNKKVCCFIRGSELLPTPKEQR